MFGIGLPEMILIMALALIVVGPDKLPDLARSIAKGVLDLKKTVNSLKEDLEKENPLGTVKPELEEAAEALKKQLGEPGPDGWTGVAGDYDSVDPHEQAIQEQSATEEIAVADIGEPDDAPEPAGADRPTDPADSALSAIVEPNDSYDTPVTEPGPHPKDRSGPEPTGENGAAADPNHHQPAAVNRDPADRAS